MFGTVEPDCTQDADSTAAKTANTAANAVLAETEPDTQDPWNNNYCVDKGDMGGGNLDGLVPISMYQLHVRVQDLEEEVRELLNWKHKMEQNSGMQPQVQPALTPQLNQPQDPTLPQRVGKHQRDRVPTPITKPPPGLNMLPAPSWDTPKAALVDKIPLSLQVSQNMNDMNAKTSDGLFEGVECSQCTQKNRWRRC